MQQQQQQQQQQKKKKTEIKWSVWYGDIENATRFYSPASRKQIYYKIMEYYNIFNAKYIINSGGLTDVTTTPKPRTLFEHEHLLTPSRILLKPLHLFIIAISTWS